MVEFLFLNAISALIGIVVGVLCEDRIKAAWYSLRRKALLKLRPHMLAPPGPETFILGKREIPFLVVDGDGESTYARNAIVTLLEEQPTPIPAEIEELRTMIAAREADKRSRGMPAMWNGPLYSLRRYAIDRTGLEEDLKVTFTFAPSDYFTFQATVMSLDVNLVSEPLRLTLRQKYLRGGNRTDPIPFLAQGFGVALVALSADHKLILGWRSPDAGARPGELDVTVVEAVHPVLDRGAQQRGPDLYRTAVRGTWEEAGLEVQDEQVIFLGFGVDTVVYQWNFVGMIRLRESAADALDSRRRGSGGKWETRRFDVLSSDPATVFRFLDAHRLWSVGWVAIYWALVHEHGKRAVDEAARSILKS